MASSIFSLAFSTMLLVLVFFSSTGESYINDSQLCNGIICGRGNCSFDIATPFSFVCRCDPGWRRTLSSDNNEIDLPFLPCVIPNCSLDSSCIPAPPPPPPLPYNFSIFDPCYWTYCGEGKCNNDPSTTYTYRCECNPGYSNLMNISYFPCFSSCAIGADCSRLGVRSSDVTSTPEDSSQGETAGSGTSQGIRFRSGGFHCIGVIMMSVALALWI